MSPETMIGKNIYTLIPEPVSSERKKIIDELQRWHQATLGRETRILDLKHEVNKLLRRLNEPIRYPSAEDF
ncbi:MAG: hypothetical protein JXA21_08005 [Anaerolineae bacterium]|nr:hypothetical protein [Anaerolineae bacterium]